MKNEIMYSITASIVTYSNETESFQKTIKSFLDTDLKVKLYVIDNSPTDKLRGLCKDNRVEYIFNNKNIGFAAGHNVAICKYINISKYHLVLNPDIFFKKNTLRSIYDFMETDKTVGLVMPKIFCLDGKIQYLCKLLPTPLNLILRRLNIGILNTLFKNENNKYELRFTGYDKIMEVPCLSGCFMFVRNDAFRKVGFFDERFFMYMEDFDLSRRIHNYYRTFFYPQAVVYHEHMRGSYKKFGLLMRHILSAIKYFNKWGWFFDKERMRINRETLEKLK